VGHWIYFLHPPREDFTATITDDELAAFAAHAEWLSRLYAEGVLIVAGPCLGPLNTGVVIFEAADAEAAQRTVAEEPVAGRGHMRGDLRPYRVGFLRGRD
jgi:uncharacterized protein YciI